MLETIALSIITTLFTGILGLVAWIANRFAGRLDAIETNVIEMGRDVSRLAGFMEGKG